ncbi:MAG: hypothetical protein R3D32_15770 [Nitratireductor sp.]
MLTNQSQWTLDLQKAHPGAGKTDEMHTENSRATRTETGDWQHGGKHQADMVVSLDLQDTNDGSTIVVEVGTSAADLNALIASVPDGTTIILADGIHQFDQPIVVARDSISLTGQSETGTVLNFSLAAGSEASLIQVTGGAKTYVDTTKFDAAAGSTILETDAGHGLQVGDAVYLYMPNTQEYLDANGWSNVDWADADTRPFREFITTVTAVDGGTLTLADPLPFDFVAGETRIFSIDLLQDITLANFTVTNDLGEADHYNFVNTLDAYLGTSAIDLVGTEAITLSAITVIDAPSSAVTLRSSIHADVSDLYIDGSHNMGGGGNGYGIELAEAFNNSLTGLEIFNMRHSLVLSAWNAETGNIIEVLDTNRDINFHGSPDLGNEILVLHSVMDYQLALDASGGTQWAIVSDGGASFAQSDISGANNVRFVHAEGSGASDWIMGADSGCYLNGHGSNDTLVGGDGDDVIVGGLRRDIMTGGGGSDLFILQMGDDLDRITDFQFGTGGDTLVFSGNPAVDGIEDLVFTQDGQDLRIRYGSNSTVILEHTLLSDVDGANFEFDPGSDVYGDLWLGMGG